MYQALAVLSPGTASPRMNRLEEIVCTPLDCANVPPRIVSVSSSADCSCTSASGIVTIKAEFTDSDLTDHHSAIIDWGDGTTTSGLITEAGGAGFITVSHPYSQGGIYVVTLRLSDEHFTVSSQTNALVAGARLVNGVHGQDPDRVGHMDRRGGHRRSSSRY